MDKMSKLRNIGIAIITFGLGFIVGFASQGRQSEDEYRYLRIFTDALRIIKDSYVEQVNMKDLIYGALSGCLLYTSPSPRD